MAATSLRGSPELKRRIKAVRLCFKPLGKQWAVTTRDLAQQSVAVRTGVGRRSIRVKSATQRKASVAAIYYIAILNTGAKAHVIKPRKAKGLAFEAGGRTVFSRKVMKPLQRPTGFASKAAHESLRRHPMAETLIDEWNKSA